MRIIRLILFLVALVFAQQNEPRWQYQGNYILGEVLADLCDRTGCQLGISGDVVELPITLSVRTSSPTILLSSIRNSLSLSGFTLFGSPSGQITVSRDAFVESFAFVDHLGNVQVVPKLHKLQYLKADSIQGLKDSLSKIPSEETHPEKWFFIFMSVSENAVKKYGLDVSHPLAYGNISLSHPLENTHLASSWSFDYLSQVDSLFEYRTFVFDLDSNVSFSWGTQKQVLDKVIINDGIQQNSYAWRQYGIDVTIKHYPKMFMSYTLRSPDESTINGSSYLGLDGSITVVASYSMQTDGESCFLPFHIFCTPSRTRENRYFILLVKKQK